MVELNATTSTGSDANLTWSPNDGSLSATTGLSVTASPTVSTYYFADFQVSGCAVRDSVYIQIDSLPPFLAITADPTEDPYCQGQRVVLSSPEYDPALFPNISHAWSGIGLETADSLYNVVLTTTDTFTYQRITTNGGCVTAAALTLNVVTDEDISIQLIDNQAICPGDTIQLNVAVPEAGVDYFWTSLNNPNFSSTDPELRVSPTETDTYTLTAVNGCGADLVQTVTLFVTRVPVALTIVEVPVLTGANPSVDLQAVVTAGGGDAAYEWTLNGALIGASNPLLGYQPAVAELPAYAIVTYRNACELLMDSVLLQILDYQVPNIFSPNGDGVNDVFKPFFLGAVDQLTLEVYNRWGQRVFVSDNPANFGWDGRFESLPAPADVYIYHIRVGVGGESITTSGQVTLVR